MATIRIETNTFEWSHGAKPRGQGQWWFEIDTGLGEPVGFRAPVLCMYTDACKAVRARARKLGGASGIKLLP